MRCDFLEQLKQLFHAVAGADPAEGVEFPGLTVVVGLVGIGVGVLPFR